MLLTTKPTHVTTAVPTLLGIPTQFLLLTMIGKERSAKLQKLVEQGKWSEVNALIKSDHDQLLVASSSLETLPVHGAVRKAAPLKVVKRMVQAAPDALRHMDKIGRIPLHHVSSRPNHAR